MTEVVGSLVFFSFPDALYFNVQTDLSIGVHGIYHKKLFDKKH